MMANSLLPLRCWPTLGSASAEFVAAQHPGLPPGALGCFTQAMLDLSARGQAQDGLGVDTVRASLLSRDPLAPVSALPASNVRHVEALTTPRPVVNVARALQRRALGQRGGFLRPDASALSSTMMYTRFRRLMITLAHLEHVFCVVFSPDSRHFYTGSDDFLVKQWCTSTGLVLRTLRGHGQPICELAVSADSQLVASAALDKTVRVWNAADGSPAQVIVHDASVLRVAFTKTPVNFGSRRAHALITSSLDSTCRIYPLDTWQPIVVEISNLAAAQAGQHARLECADLHVHPASTEFVVACNDKAARVVSLRTGQVLQRLGGHLHDLDWVRYTGDGKLVLTLDQAGFTRVYGRVRDEAGAPYQLVRTMSCDDPRAGSNQPSSSSLPGISTDDKHLVLQAPGLPVTVFDLQTGARRATLLPHKPPKDKYIMVARPHPIDPRLMLVAGGSSQVILWDLTDGCHVVKAWETPTVTDITFSPCGQYFAAVSSAGFVSLYGMGSRERYYLAPREQFFVTDYMPICMDASLNVLDEVTQRPPHMVQGKPCNSAAYVYSNPPMHSWQIDFPGGEDTAAALEECRKPDSSYWHVVHALPDNGRAFFETARSRAATAQAYLQMQLDIRRSLLVLFGRNERMRQWREMRRNGRTTWSSELRRSRDEGADDEPRQPIVLYSPDATLEDMVVHRGGFAAAPLSDVQRIFSQRVVQLGGSVLDQDPYMAQLLAGDGGSSSASAPSDANNNTLEYWLHLSAQDSSSETEDSDDAGPALRYGMPPSSPARGMRNALRNNDAAGLARQARERQAHRLDAMRPAPINAPARGRLRRILDSDEDGENEDEEEEEEEDDDDDVVILDEDPRVRELRLVLQRDEEQQRRLRAANRARRERQRDMLEQEMSAAVMRSQASGSDMEDDDGSSSDWSPSEEDEDEAPAAVVVDASGDESPWEVPDELRRRSTRTRRAAAKRSYRDLSGSEVEEDDEDEDDDENEEEQGAETQPQNVVSNSSWLTKEAPIGPLYVPQCGDVVTYLPRVHERFYARHTQLEAPDIDTSVPSVTGVITDIEYQFPKLAHRRDFSVFCRVHLDLAPGDDLASSSSSSSSYSPPSSSVSRSLVVDVHPEAQTDYVIPREHYESAIQANWSPGDRFRMYFADQRTWYTGLVVFRSDDEHGDGFDTLVVVYDESGELAQPAAMPSSREEALQLSHFPAGASPWELFPLDPISQRRVQGLLEEDVQMEAASKTRPRRSKRKRARGGRQIGAKKLRIRINGRTSAAADPHAMNELQVRPAPSRLSDAQRSACARVLEDAMADPQSVWFVENVDTTTNPLYPTVVPVQVSLRLMYTRLDSYYRSVMGMLHDALTLRRNAVLYNQDGSEVAAAAIALEKRIRDRVWEAMSALPEGDRPVLFELEPSVRHQGRVYEMVVCGAGEEGGGGEGRRAKRGRKRGKEEASEDEEEWVEEGQEEEEEEEVEEPPRTRRGRRRRV